MSQLIEFPRFMELPLELRNMVYHFEIQRRRLITIGDQNKPYDETKQLISCKYPICALLHVSSEARQEALKTFEKVTIREEIVSLIQGVSITMIDYSSSIEVYPPIYFNPNVDTMDYKSPDSYERCKPTRERVRSFALNSGTIKLPNTQWREREILNGIA